MKSVMTHSFSQVPKAEIPRSTFDRTHGYKSTFDASFLVPFFVDEALPGDTFNVKATLFARLATPIFPVMDNMYMDTHFFAIPIRLVWDNFQKFMGEQTDPGDSTDYLVPQLVMPAGEPKVGSMSDHFGIPINTPGLSVSALWHRAYNLVFNQWYRDENMVDSLPVPKGDGPDVYTDYVLQRRGKRHDYFTSALPWPQKGESVTIPLGSSAPVIGTGAPIFQNPGGGFPSTLNSTTAADASAVRWSAGNAPSVSIREWNDPKLEADLSEATAATINQLRQSFAVQKLFERDARGGSRYTEIVRAHFNVTSPDARLQRAEYLGGGSAAINFTPVPQTSHTDPAVTPQGNLASYAKVSAHGHGFTKSFTEHTLILGIVSVRADLTYQQGLNRMFSRRTKFDFYWPALSHLGEQEVLRKEIYATGVPANDDVIFGYQERFAEYRYKPSLITGDFRSTAPLSLDAWHLSQEFTAPPTLDKSFIEEHVPVDRIVAVTNQPQFLFDSYIQMKCARPMPVYGVPGLIDHF